MIPERDTGAEIYNNIHKFDELITINLMKYFLVLVKMSAKSSVSKAGIQ